MPQIAEIVGAALAGLRAIFKPGFKLAKAGVMLMNLQPASVHQGELDLGDGAIEDRSRLMGALDAINDKYGRGTMLLASAGVAGEQRKWSMKQARLTPRYTTRLEDIPVARA